MLYLHRTLILFIFLALVCCQPAKKSEQDIDRSGLTIIKVPEKYKIAGNFDDYFSTASYIPLETSPNSLIGDVDRLSFFDGRIYILDRKNNSVLIFDETGDFLNKIHNVGNGPGEYESLMDFAIDREGKRLVLYSDRPYRLFYFDLKGTFIKYVALNRLSDYIGAIGGKVQLQVWDKKELLNEISEDGGSSKNLIMDAGEKRVFFNSFGVAYPSLTTSSRLNILMPYSDTVFTYDGKKVRASYFLDFGERKFPQSNAYLEMEYGDIYSNATRNGLGFPLYNFRETENHVVFSYAGHRMVIYDKNTGQARIYLLIQKKGNPIPFFKYFAHDGADNNIVSICPAQKFIQRVQDELEGGILDSIPKNIMKIANNLTAQDNPVLMIYTFK